MATIPSAEFQNVQRIASLCDAVDKDWFGSLNQTEPEKAIQECEAHLASLAEDTFECGAIVFEQIRFRQEVGDRERVRLTKFALTSNEKLLEPIEKSFGISRKEEIFPLSQKEADFYMLYNGRITHFKVSSKYDSIIELRESDINLIWDTSTSKIQAMIKKDWNHCLVTSTYSWDHVVPIPMAKKPEEEKT